MATLSPPILHSDAEGQLGRPFDFLGDAIALELAENFDVTMNGLVVMLGDLSGSGSDTGRLRRATGFGWSTTFSDMATETDPIVATAIQAAYDSITIGRVGLAFEESFTRAVLADDPISVEYLAQSFLSSYLATVRSKLAAQVASFSTNVADATATLDVDDWIALRNAFENTTGFAGMANALLKPRQVGYLRSSIRAETGLQFPEPHEAYQRLQVNNGLRMSYLGIDIYASGDITTSSGDDFGGAWVPGAVGMAVGDASGIGDISDANGQVVPGWGIVITRKTDGQSATKRVDGNALLGLTTISPNVAPQFLIRNDDGV